MPGTPLSELRKEPPTGLAEALGAAAEGLSGRDILDVCRGAERRWVSLLLRGEVREPPLPPRHIYEEALRTRQHSGRVAPPATYGPTPATST